MSGEKQHFNSLREWADFGPDLGDESFPKFITPTQTYKQWLLEHPEGYIHPGVGLD